MAELNTSGDDTVASPGWKRKSSKSQQSTSSPKLIRSESKSSHGESTTGSKSRSTSGTAESKAENSQVVPNLDIIKMTTSGRTKDLVRNQSGTSSNSPDPSPRIDIANEYSSFMGLSRPIKHRKSDKEKDKEKVEKTDKEKPEQKEEGTESNKRRPRPTASPTVAARKPKFNTLNSLNLKKEEIDVEEPKSLDTDSIPSSGSSQSLLGHVVQLLSPRGRSKSSATGQRQDGSPLSPRQKKFSRDSSIEIEPLTPKSDGSADAELNPSPSIKRPEPNIKVSLPAKSPNKAEGDSPLSPSHQRRQSSKVIKLMGYESQQTSKSGSNGPQSAPEPITPKSEEPEATSSGGSLLNAVNPFNLIRNLSSKRKSTPKNAAGVEHHSPKKRSSSKSEFSSSAPKRVIKPDQAKQVAVAKERLQEMLAAAGINNEDLDKNAQGGLPIKTAADVEKWIKDSAELRVGSVVLAQFEDDTWVYLFHSCLPCLFLNSVTWKGKIMWARNSFNKKSEFGVQFPEKNNATLTIPRSKIRTMNEIKLDAVIVEKVSAIEPVAFEEAKRTLTRRVTQMRLSVDKDSAAELLGKEIPKEVERKDSAKEEDPWETWSYDEDDPSAYVDDDDMMADEFEMWASKWIEMQAALKNPLEFDEAAEDELEPIPMV